MPDSVWDAMCGSFLIVIQENSGNKSPVNSTLHLFEQAWSVMCGVGYLRLPEYS